MANIKVVILTYNGGLKFIQLMESIKKQKEITFQDVYIIDSSSTDDTVKIAEKYGSNIKIIPKIEFGHGKTRALASDNISADYIVFLTQDIILENETSIIDLCRPLQIDPSIGVSYGRQLPTRSADFFGNFSRIFNYPNKSYLKTQRDIRKLGIKATFCSDSFAAYNRKNLLAIGNFVDTDFGEDALAAAMFLLNGYKVFYCADACVYHSHKYSLKEEFFRYMKIGQFHKREKNIFSKFGTVNSEGIKYVIAEWSYLMKSGRWYNIPVAIIREINKFIGYKIGKFI